MVIRCSFKKQYHHNNDKKLTTDPLMYEISTRNKLRSQKRRQKSSPCHFHLVSSSMAKNPNIFLSLVMYVFISLLILADTASTFRSPFLLYMDEAWLYECNLNYEGDYVVQWTPSEDQIMFRITVRTRGYIGFGIHTEPNMDGADIVVGWVHSGKAYLQDRHGVDHQEPQIDRHQDWTLIAGYENDTHTTLIMSRDYNTCDKKDHILSNDTVHLLWAYHADDPVDPDRHPRLHYHGWRRGTATALLLQGVVRETSRNALPLQYHENIFSLHHTPESSWVLQNPDVEIPSSSETLYWCKMFKRPYLNMKHQIIKYEPIFSTGNEEYLQHITVYECISFGPELDEAFEELSHQPGQDCHQSSMAHLSYTCSHVVAMWAKGSQEMSYPPEAGYALLPDGPKYYMMETHYDNPEQFTLYDNSGLRLIYTSKLRLHDAGVLNIGMEPNWKHIIPPQQRHVLSESHCVAECTHAALPHSGIYVFGSILQTHSLGHKVQVRHIRDDEELEPIIQDNNYQNNFQEYRQLQPKLILPGDHLMVKCSYNSQERTSITLGGYKTRDELCQSYLFYWPRVQISSCTSMPSLNNVLHSLGIEELSADTTPIKIKKPAELEGKTLQWRLLTYNWDQNFSYFQQIASTGTFNSMCHSRGHPLVEGLEDYDYKYPIVKSTWKPENVCKKIRKHRRHKQKSHSTSSLFSPENMNNEEEIMFDEGIFSATISRIDVLPYNHMNLQHQQMFEEQLLHRNINSGAKNAIEPSATEPPELLEELDLMEHELEKELHKKEKSKEVIDKEKKEMNIAPVLSRSHKYKIDKTLLVILIIMLLNSSGVRWI